MNQLDLPPRRPLPPRTRDRIRHAVTTGTEGNGAAPRRARTRHSGGAVAAAAAVLAAGGLVLVQSVKSAPDDDIRGGSVPESATTGPYLAMNAMASTLDRCAAAAPDLPSRDRWHAVLGVEELGVTVVAARVNDKPLICQTTDTTVTVTDPDAAPTYAPGTRTGVLLNSPQGVIAGVTDPAWGEVGIYADDGYLRVSAGARVGGEFFVLLSDPAPDRYQVRVYELVDDNNDPPGWESAIPVGTPAAPAIEKVDRPNTPMAHDQELLDECLASSQAGGSGWEVAAGVPFRHDGRLLLARRGLELGLCEYEPRMARSFSWQSTYPTDNSLTRLKPCVVSLTLPNFEGPVMAGVLSPQAASVVLHFPDDDSVLVPVVNSTFLVPPVPRPRTVEAVEVYDKDHELRYEGPPACQDG
jgi:hypothetical protein